jgi:hypothetical protein
MIDHKFRSGHFEVTTQSRHESRRSSPTVTMQHHMLLWASEIRNKGLPITGVRVGPWDYHILKKNSVLSLGTVRYVAKEGRS